MKCHHGCCYLNNTKSLLSPTLLDFCRNLSCATATLFQKVDESRDFILFKYTCDDHPGLAEIFAPDSQLKITGINV